MKWLAKQNLGPIFDAKNLVLTVFEHVGTSPLAYFESKSK